MAKNRGPQTNSHRDEPAEDRVSEPGGGPSVQTTGAQADGPRSCEGP